MRFAVLSCLLLLNSVWRITATMFPSKENSNGRPKHTSAEYSEKGATENGMATHPGSENKAFNIYFVKLRKTGSTTMYNIFSRFAVNHRLRVFTLSQNNFVKRKKYNMFIDHNGYAAKRMYEILELPYENVTMLRNPLTWMDSNLNYFHSFKHLNLGKNNVVSVINNLHNESWLMENKNVKKLQHMFCKKLQIQPGDPNIMSAFRKLDDRFLVLISEYFDESLILMRRLFKWEFSDVLYSTLRVTDYKHKPIDETLYKKFCQWSSDSCLLYEYFNKTFWRKFDKEINILSEVAHFKSVLKDVNEFCSPIFAAISSEAPVKTSEKIEFQSTEWHDSFVFTAMDCLLTRIAPWTYRPLFYYTQNPNAPCEDKCVVFDEKYMCKKICPYSNSSAASILEKLVPDKDAYMLY